MATPYQRVRTEPTVNYRNFGTKYEESDTKAYQQITTNHGKSCCVCPTLPPSRAHRGAHDTCILICIQAIHINIHAAGALPMPQVEVLVRRGTTPVLAPRVRAGHVAPRPKRHACTLAMGG